MGTRLLSQHWVLLTQENHVFKATNYDVQGCCGLSCETPPQKTKQKPNNKQNRTKQLKQEWGFGWEVQLQLSMASAEQTTQKLFNEKIIFNSNLVVYYYENISYIQRDEDFAGLYNQR